MKKTAIFLSILLMLSTASCGDKKSSSTSSAASTTTAVTETVTETQTAETTTKAAKEEKYKYQEYASMTAEEITSKLTLEQKAGQMCQAIVYYLDNDQMKENCYGSIISKSESVVSSKWRTIVDSFQKLAVESDSGIPYVYGQDDVHGVNYCVNSVIFPHNIGLGAANDPELMYQVGLITADEAKLCHMLWNFAPCIAQSVDPRWGRTYESYGADLDIIKSLSTEYTKGLLDGGMIVCPKHFFADGNVVYGTGEKSNYDRLIDRGDAVLTDDEINELLSVYQAQIDAGVQTIMISHSSVNGVKMHENAKYIQYLKNEMGFKGFILSDWDSIHNTSPATYDEQVITAVNAGIDMLMEEQDFEETRQIIVQAVKDGKITEERINDAVTRIIQVKLDMGLFDDPFYENLETVQSETGSDEYRAVAEKLVEESLVLLKNDGNVLPLKEGTSVYITGPAADNAPAQCGGWTLDWNSAPSDYISGLTTILDGFKEKADDYGINIITDKSKAQDADVVLLVVGEESYAEWLGDTEDLELCGQLGLEGNAKAIQEAKELGKPVVTCIVAGRQVIIGDHFDDWDSVVMCYLPGSEGQGVADVLCGGENFRGKLPSPWYSSIEQIGTDECWLKKGFGMTY